MQGVPEFSGQLGTEVEGPRRPLAPSFRKAARPEPGRNPSLGMMESRCNSGLCRRSFHVVLKSLDYTAVSTHSVLSFIGLPFFSMVV